MPPLMESPAGDGKQGLLPFLRQARPVNVLTTPVIYSLVVPLVLLDAWLTLYQAVCFPLYRIALVPRRRYFVLDRHRLPYLNAIEKLDCAYCSYATGVLAYAREIAARTEQYWCPIKHAQAVRAPHDRYQLFLDYGDGAGYHRRLPQLRRRLHRGMLLGMLALLGSGVTLLAQNAAPARPEQGQGATLDLPSTATALEGVPRVRVDVTAEKTRRRTLAPSEAAGSRLLIRIADGQLAWSSRGDAPLLVSRAGEFTYLLSTEPGRYIRIRQVNDRLTYVEHVDTDAGSVTYWGELRVVLRK